ncbi:MAG: serine/threonine-protein kinase, partial [Myxococcota bacterium]
MSEDPEHSGLACTVSKPGESSEGSEATLVRPGDRLGNYKIMEQLGEGGFAVVFLAEQDRPVRRRVALKILKLGMDTKEVIARFEAERQALALMDHVNVAKVFDAGATESGRPYFVMEYVAGTPVTEYCDRHRLSLPERLELFIPVCEAVQHAHQKAIIHRDIKPSNVLVANREGRPVPKVIDFGVSKALGQRLVEKTIHTAQGQLIGTPMYMSPEQAEMSGENVDTRSDVYSLGVVLYELLTGVLPFDPDDFRKASFATIQRILREEEIPRPSARVAGLGGEGEASARHRQLDAQSLQKELRGDLDWIALKALEKDRGRRYDTPRALAEDVARHLGHEAVLASPPSVGYRARKFVQRNAAAVFVVGATLLMLLVLAAATAIQARRVAAERDVARRAQAELEKLTEFQARQLGGVDVELMGLRMRD